MKTIDLSLFEGEGFEIKTAHRDNTEGRNYVIEFVSSPLELKLMKEQENITEKAKSWKTLESGDIERWKDLIKKIIKENDDTLDEKDINKLKPMHVMGILMALMSYLNDRSQVIFEGLSQEAKNEVKKVQNDIKKKAVESL